MSTEIHLESSESDTLSQEHEKLHIAVVVPVYNTELYLRECIDSILSQSYTEFDIYIINDASTDRSKEILEEYKLNDPRVHLYHTLENVGVSKARNYALGIIEDTSDSDIICYIDSDDLVTQDYFESIVKHFVTFSSDCVIVGYKSFDKNTKLTDISRKDTPLQLNQENAYKFCFGIDPFSQRNHDSISLSLCNMAFKTKTVRGIRFDEEIKTAEDQDYILRCLCKSAQLTVDDNIYYLYRMRNSSLTNSDKIRLSDIDVFLDWINKKRCLSITCRETVEHLAFQNFWRAVQAAAMQNKLNNLWLDLQARLKIIKSVFITNELHSCKNKKRMLILNLGKFATSLYIKLSRIKSSNRNLNAFD